MTQQHRVGIRSFEQDGCVKIELYVYPPERPEDIIYIDMSLDDVLTLNESLFSSFAYATRRLQKTAGNA
jgi:hypothetical protein